MLMPAGVLIVLLLGAIAVDLSVVRMAQRDLFNVASSAANDAAAAGLDKAEYRRSGDYVIDLDRATAAVDRALGNRMMAARITRRSVTLGPGPDEITVELEMPVSYLFAKTISATVRARTSASVQQR